MRRVADVSSENVLSIVLLAVLAALLLAVFAPFQFVGDTWMTLVSGREIAEHGIPDREALTVFALGERWNDQQWLAQFGAYGAWRVGGLALVALLGTAAVVVAYAFGVAAARRRGGSALACALVLLTVMAAAPWSWTIRAQVLALPLFVGTLWILVSSRDGVTGRTFLAVPLLVVWANVHGSVLLGAVLATLLAAVTSLEAVRRRSDVRHALSVGTALAGASWLTLLATPYAPGRMVDYYRLFLFDQPFEGVLSEWKRTGLAPETVTFWALGAIVLALCIRYRSRLSAFEFVVLALTFVGGVQAIRGIVWFVLSCLVILPVVLDGLLRGRRLATQRGPNLVLAATFTGAAVISAVVLLARGDRPIEREWPEAGLPAVAAALRAPDADVWGTDRHADWLLWHLPELRGRIAFDVRFELYSRAEIEAIVRWNGETGANWKQVSRPYRIVIIDRMDETSHLESVASEAGARVVFEDDAMAVVVRAD